jgi:predicted TIM-barrel fold metal-dependent hydrolase
MVEALGADRVMLGADLPPNVGIQVESIRVLGLSKDDEAMVLGGTATEVFKLGG